MIFRQNTKFALLSDQMILAFPYHDPEGKYNIVFQKRFSDLRRIFNKICISVTSPTRSQNFDFLKVLERTGFNLHYNQAGTSIGDHFREALKLAAFSEEDNESIHFGHIDRILYALENYEKNFTFDINKKIKPGMLIFERSFNAWKTHPSNYYFAEHLVIKAYYKLLGRQIDLNFCELVVDKMSAQKISELSVSNSYNVAGEWILLSLLNGISVKTRKVDWLSWEDPFWEKIDLPKLKKVRGSNPDETYKRLVAASEFMMLLQEVRFTSLFKTPKKT